MADEVPPMVLELRAKAGELFSTLKETDARVAKMEANTEGATSRSSHAYHMLSVAGKAALTGIVGSAITVGVASVKMAGDFQEATTQLVTGAGESEKNIDMVKSGLLSMAGQVGVSAQELAKGMYLVESAGFHGAQGLSVMKAAAEGAKVGAADMTSVSDGLTTVLNAYHMSGTQAVSVTNQLIATVANGKMHMDDLSRSLGNVVPLAATAGIKFDEVGAAMATMTGQGMQARRAAMNLSGVIRALENPSVIAQKEMEALGVSSLALGKNFGRTGLAGSLNILVEAIQHHMGPAGTVLIESMKKQTSSVKAFQQVLDAASPTQKGFIATLAKSAGNVVTYQHALDTMTPSQKKYVAEMSKMVGGHKALENALAGMTTTQLKGNAATTSFQQALAAMTPSQQTYIAALSKMVGGSQGLQAALLLSGGNAATFRSNIQKIGEAAKHTTGDVDGWKETQSDFNNKLAATKAGIEAMGIRLGSILIPKIEEATQIGVKWATWLQHHKTVAEALAAVIGSVLGVAIAAYVAHLAVAAVESIRDFGTMIASGWKWAAEQAASVSETLALWAMYAAEWIATQATAIAESVSLWVSYAAEWVATQASSIAESVTLWAMYAAQNIARVAMVVASNIAGAASTAAAWVAANATMLLASGGILLALGALVLGVLYLAKHWKQVWGDIKHLVKDAFDWIKKHITLIMTVALGPLGLAIVELGKHWKQIWGDIKAVLQDAWNFIRNVIQMIIHVGLWYIRTEVELLRTIWTDVWNGIRFVVTSVWSTLSGIFHTIVNGGLALITTAVNGLRIMWDTAWGAVKAAVQDAWNFVKPIFDAISNAASAVGNAISNVSHAASSVGGALGHIPGVGGLLSHIGLVSGGYTQGPVGAPYLEMIHGGEYMLSNDMLAGRQRVAPEVVAAVAKQGGGGGNSVVVNATTNASPSRIASEIGWVLRNQG